MSATLYRAYRPKKFADVIGQQHIVTTLQNAIRSERVAHAYLFTGPRGTGKTTVARIFAASVNATAADGTPLADDVRARLADGSSLDIIEIDAASHTGVDNIRSLRDTIALAPTEARYKVYIIDEVHMLSSGAFNALLKTLEEPPAHAIFILATTDVHKVPATILSRCQRFDFARFSVRDIVTKLAAIATKEKVDISPEALEMIALAADGGMRDAESLLAQVFALEDKNITVAEVKHILGTTDAQDVMAFVAALGARKTMDALTVVTRVAADGYNMETFLRAVVAQLRTILYLTVVTGDDDDAVQKLIAVTRDDITTLRAIAAHLTATEVAMMIDECTMAIAASRATTIPQLPAEVAAVRVCARGANTATPTTTPTPPTIRKAPTRTRRDNTVNPATTQTADVATAVAVQDDDAVAAAWTACVGALDANHKTLAQLLTQCSAVMTNPQTLTLTVPYGFYKDKIMERSNALIIERELKARYGRPLKLHVVVATNAGDTSATSKLLSYAAQLMGSAT